MADAALNDFIKPFDAGSAIIGNESGYTPDAPSTGMNLGTFNPGFDAAANRPTDSGYYGVFNQLNPSQKQQAQGKALSVSLNRTNPYGGGQIEGLNYGGGVRPTDTFNSLVDKRQQIYATSNQNFNELQQQAFNNKDLLSDVPTNGIGRLAVLQRLNKEFGPGWNSNPEAVNIYKAFDSQIAQHNDIETLTNLYNQGKNVQDYIKDSTNGPQFSYIIKLGDQVLSQAGFTPGNADQFILNQGLSGRVNNGALRDFFAGGNYR